MLPRQVVSGFRTTRQTQWGHTGTKQVDYLPLCELATKSLGINWCDCQYDVSPLRRFLVISGYALTPA